MNLLHLRLMGVDRVGGFGMAEVLLTIGAGNAACLAMAWSEGSV